jgi:hypothetical protein
LNHLVLFEGIKYKNHVFAGMAALSFGMFPLKKGGISSLQPYITNQRSW